MRVHVGTIVSIRRVASSDALGGQPGIEIQLFSDDQFPVRDQIMVLQIGARQFFLSGYPNGDLNTVVFTLTEEEFAAVSCGDPVIVQYGLAPSDEVWQFGNQAFTCVRSVLKLPCARATFTLSMPSAQQLY